MYVRGLIEFTNVCKNDCLYCGIRRSNPCAQRYRLTQEEILACCREGYALGYRTFVLQGGEDPYFTPARLETLIRAIKAAHPDCALTLSVGEHSREDYQRWYDAGADRYLLRHETANDAHYRSLHPQGMSPERRKRCLWDLKEIGYQVGCGFMVGTPGQTLEHLAEDLCFLQRFQPDMVGIGPFLPQKDTPFGGEPPGELELTLFLLGLTRLLLPSVLLPATTALGTLHPQGRELGVQAGANVCMPRSGGSMPSTITSSTPGPNPPRAGTAWQNAWPPSAARWWSTGETKEINQELTGKLCADRKERKNKYVRSQIQTGGGVY